MLTLINDPYVKEIAGAIAQTIRRRVDTNDVPITPTRQQQMTIALTEFVSDALDKYIDGAKKYETDITECNLDQEIRKEQLDSFWYTAAKTW